MKVVCGLGNPGEEYATTRHNVGWWVLDAARRAWGFSAFAKEGRARISTGIRAGHEVRLVRPVTYMNRSGSALSHLRDDETFDLARDLLVILDDAALDVGRIRLRSGGSSGGHNGLKSIESVLGTQAYARLRIGVDGPPPDIDLADWVLSPFAAEEAERVRALLPDLVAAVDLWLEQGTDAAANRYNR
jgi:PTH1 family peptidyl-tRNA hydrolase